MAWKNWGLAALIGALAFADSDGGGSDSDSGGSDSDSGASDSDSNNDGRADSSDSGDSSTASYSDSGTGENNTTVTGKKPKSGEPGAVGDLGGDDLNDLTP